MLIVWIKENQMKKTVGTMDKVIRVVVAIAAVIVAFAVGASTALGIILLVVAMILLITGFSGYCPVYSLLKVDTLSEGKGSGRRVAH